MSGPIVLSFDGVALNSGGLFGHFSRQGRAEDRRGTAITVEPAGRLPVHVRTQPGERVVPVHVLIKSGTLEDQIELLMQTFSVGTTGELKVDYGGTTRVLDGTVINAIPRDQSPQLFTAVLSVPDALWREETVNLEVATINTSGDTFPVTNMGNAPERKAVVRVRGSNLKEGSEDWRYFTEIIFANRVDRPYFEPVDVVEAAWDHAAEVLAERSLANGNDIRVLVDGVIVPHWAEGLDTANAKIWINAVLSAAVEAKLSDAVTAGVPANGGTLNLESNEADALQQSGHLLYGDELIKYTGKGDNGSSVTGITRGARGTTSASHSAGAVGYFAERRVQVMYGYTGAAAPEARDELEPLIDLVNSTNTSWVWSDFMHETDPRSAHWTRDLVTARDAQAGRILLPSGEPLGTVAFEYQEDGAEAGKPAFNTLRKTFPSGLANGGGGNALSVTARVIADTLALKVLGRDNDGNEEELSSEGGPVTTSTLNIAEPAEPIFEVEFYVRSQVMVKNPEGAIQSSIPLPATGPYDDTAQQFTSPDAFLCAGVIVRIQNATGNASSVQATLYTDDGADAPGVAMTAEASFAIPALGGDYEAVFTWATAVELQAGSKYWINLRMPIAGFTQNPRTYRQVYDGLALDSGVLVPGEVMRFRVLGVDGVIFGPFAVAENGEQVTFDAVTATLDAAKVPYINQLARADAYWHDGTLSSDTTGQALTLAILAALNDDIEIDLGNQRVTNITADEPADYGLTATDDEDWMTFFPGVNTLRHTETNLDQVVIDVDHFGRWE